MEEPQAIIFNARALYNASEYVDCVEYIKTHFRSLKKDRFSLGKAYSLQAQAYYQLENHKDAILSALHALEIQPNDEEAYYWLGNIYREIGFYKMAENAYEKAISLSPNKEHYYFKLASLYKIQNKINEAIFYYQKILSLNPRNTKAYQNMSVCFRYESLAHEHHTKVIDLLLTPSITEEEKMHCYFTLGKLYYDCKQFDKAFIYMQAANAIQAQVVPFDSTMFSQKIDNIIEAFNRGRKNKNFGKLQGEKLIFIIGIPSSGKSLVEKILVQTKSAVGLGEIHAFDKILKKANKETNKLEEFKEISDFIANEYLLEVKRRAFGDNYITIDTTPTNYQHVGIIASAFPSAKFIYCRRHPLDHILQIYFKYFSQENPFSYDLIKLAYFYLDYQRLMEFWKKNIVMQMLEVNYEVLIKQPKEHVQRICDFLDLPTPQSIPVLYDREIGEWKDYDAYLGLVKIILNKNGFMVDR